MAFTPVMLAQLMEKVKAELKAELLVELKAELQAQPKPEPVKKATTFSLQLKSNAEWNKLEKSKDAIALFSKWYATQKEFRHPKHAFNWLFKHHGSITITRSDKGEFVIAGKKSWQL